MIIDINHPDAQKIKCYGKFGRFLKGLYSVDTDSMTGKQFVYIDENQVVPEIKVDSNGNACMKNVDVYKIIGPGMYYRRVCKRMINSRRI